MTGGVYVRVELDVGDCLRVVGQGLIEHIHHHVIGIADHQRLIVMMIVRGSSLRVLLLNQRRVGRRRVGTTQMGQHLRLHDQVGLAE